MKIGYARVSTDEQDEALQVDALNAAGCDEIFIDKGVSGAIAPHDRPGFQNALDAAGEGSVLMVWKLDRLGRTQSSIIATIDSLKTAGIEFASLTEKIDTTSAMGRAVWQIIGVFAELERNLIRERTIEGLGVAKRRGKKLGRPKRLSHDQVEHARQEIEAGRNTISGMAEILGCNRKTLSARLKDPGILPNSTDWV